MLLLFWSSLALLVHTYVAFPLVVLARARLRPRPHRAGPVTPTVSVVVAAHDEAAAIAEKLASVLATDYPDDRREVVVASDGSTDGTVAAARSVPGVQVLDLPRVGKAQALDRAVAAGRSEVVVFTDANSHLAPDALRALVRPFADPAVGAVAGDQRYLDPTADEGAAGHGERSYWSLDRRLKVAESAAGHVIGATGALYAVRRDLLGPIAEGVTDDFATSTSVIEQGHRLVFAADAVAWEPVAGSADAELRRKVRVITRGLRAVHLRRALLDPRRHGFYAYQLLTHKVLRRLMGLPLLGLVVGSAGCWRRGPRYRTALAAQVAGYGLAVAALARPTSALGRSRVARLAGYFALVNAAGLAGAANLVLGRRIDRWEPERAPVAAMEVAVR